MDTMSDISPTSSFSDLKHEAGISDIELIEQGIAGDLSTDLFDASAKSHNVEVATIGSTACSNTCLVDDTPSKSSSPKEAISFEIPEHPQTLVRDSAEALSLKTLPIDLKKGEEKTAIEICSLVPLLKLLPELQVEDGHYVISGEVTTENMKHVIEYAAKVTEFNHTSTTTGQNEAKITPALYVWLAQCSSSPLFLSLKKIRLLSVTPDLSYIPLLLNTRLTLLEIRNVLPDAVYLVKSLLTILPLAAPAIKHLTLCGPQQLPQTVLYPISKLTQLKHLELDDITTIDGTSFFQRLATLPILEVLKVIARNPSTAPSTSSVSNGEGAIGFLELKSLSITSSFQTVHDLVALVSSQTLHTLDIHFELSSEEINAVVQNKAALADSRKIDALAEEIVNEKTIVAALKLAVEKADKAVKDADAVRREHILETRRAKHGANFKAREAEFRTEVENLLKDCPSKQQLSTKAALREAKEMYLTGKDRLSAMEAAHEKLSSSFIPAATKTIALDDPCISFAKTIDSIVSRWSESLGNLTLSVVNNSPSSKSPEALYDFGLTGSILLQLEQLHELRLLCIEGWRVEASSLHLKGWPNIRHVSLPVLNDVPGVNLSALQDFADLCPRLKILQLKLDISTLPQLPAESGATFALRHGLRKLTVEGSSGATDKQTPKRLARYLNVLFPYLETVTCLAASGSSAVELWTEVTELLNLLRVARRDERYRT